MDNLYIILGLEEKWLTGSVTQDDITKAYKKLASKYHPDRNNGDAEIMKQINQAYEVLGDPDRRHAYDENGTIEPPKGERSEAIKKLSQMFVMAIDEFDHTENDMIELMKDHLAQANVINHNMLEKKYHLIEKYTDASSRIKTKAQENILEGALQNCIRLARIDIKSLEALIEENKGHIKMLGDYSWDLEVEPLQIEHHPV